MSFDSIDRQFRTKTLPSLACMRCAATDGVAVENSRTQYPFDGELNSKDDPNASIPLCRDCAKEHHEYWDSMWADYYNGLL